MFYSNYNLFLDDDRIPTNVFWVDLPKVPWTIVKNYNEFVSTIEKNGLPKIISFDHDLANEHYGQLHNIDYSKFVEKTGYDCAKWLCNYIIEHECPSLPEYYIHTMNPAGKINIRTYLENFRKVYGK